MCLCVGASWSQFQHSALRVLAGAGEVRGDG